MHAGNTIKARTAFFLWLSVFLCFLAVSVYVLQLDSSINATLLVLVSFLNVLSARKHLPLFLLFLSLFYFNYSITVGEYSFLENAGAALQEVKTEEIYSLLIFIVLIFNICFLGMNPPVTRRMLTYSYDPIIVVSALITLILIFLFFFDRSDISGYSVRITPAYEYSALLFLTAIIYSGNRLIIRTFILALCFMYIANDFLFGGRITSVQLCLLLALTIFRNRLTNLRLILLFILGVFLMAVVGAYRVTFLISGFDINRIIGGLLDKALVFDTVVYAYYSSATHLASASYLDWSERVGAFWELLAYLFSGYESNGQYNLTAWVSNHYFPNVGGGILPSHIFFYFGFAGVLVFGLTLRAVLTKLAQSNVRFMQLALIVLIMMTPRWYLYTPISLVRPLIFFAVIYVAILCYRQLVPRNHAPPRNRLVLAGQ